MNDDEVRSRFAELRRADELDAPDFQRVFDRANRSTQPESVRRRWLSPLAISLAAAATIIATIGIARASRRAAFVAPPLSAWTSPTAGLLRTRGIDRMRSASVMSALIDIATASAIPRTGKNK